MGATVLGTTLLDNAMAQGLKVSPVIALPSLTPLAVAVGGRALTRTNAPLRSFGGKVYLYQWPGTHFQAAFNGTEVYFHLGPPNKQLLHVTVDNLKPVVLVTPRAGSYRISGVSAGNHRVRIELVTENQADPSFFDGFAIPPGEHAAPLPVPTRQMELIGDSHTLGYGNGSDKRNCTREEVLQQTDVKHTAGVMAAVHYGADYRVVAISGRGVVRNYDAGPGAPIPLAYPGILEEGKKADPPTPAWQPQIVVVSLGVNDFSKFQPDNHWKSRDDLHRDFEATYVRFITSLRARYPRAYFILWATDAAQGEIQAEVARVIAQLKARGETRIQFIPVNGLGLSACDWHPSLADNRLVYNKLVSLIDANPALWQGR